MTRSRLGALLVAAACAAAALGARTRQEWRPAALSSFDAVWQTINDTFPDPTFGGLDWAGVRAELRPVVQSVATPSAARDVIRDMLARLRRSHFVLLSASAATEALPGDAMVPIEIRVMSAGVVVTRVTPGSTADKAGIELLKLTFAAGSSAGNAALTFGNTPAPESASDNLANDLAAQFSDGVITVVGPPLLLTPSGTAENSLILSWPSSTTEAVLESSTTLSSSAWTNVAVTPTLNGGSYSATIPTTGDTMFYRLRLLSP